VQECLEAAACATSLHRRHGGEIEGCSAANTGQNRMRAEYVIRGIFGVLVRGRGIRGAAGNRWWVEVLNVGCGGGRELPRGERTGEGNEPRQLISPGFHNALANERPL